MIKLIVSLILFLGILGQSHANIIQPPEVPWPQRLADDIDNFLSGDDEIVTGPNDTQVILGQRLIWTEGGEWDYRPYVDVKLHLPKFAEKWRLRFTSYDEDIEEVGVNTTRAKTVQREEDLGLSIFFLSRFEKVNMTFRPRIDDDGTSHVLRFRRPSDFWVLTFRPRLELFARPKEGTGQFLGLNLGYKFNETWATTLVNEEQYTDLDNTMSTNQGLIIQQKLSENMTLYYSLIYEASNQPHYRLNRYFTSVNFEHYFRNRSMVYRLVPAMIYEREFKFHGNPQMTFELDFIF